VRYILILVCIKCVISCIFIYSAVYLYYRFPLSSTGSTASSVIVSASVTQSSLTSHTAGATRHRIFSPGSDQFNDVEFKLFLATEVAPQTEYSSCYNCNTTVRAADLLTLRPGEYIHCCPLNFALDLIQAENNMLINQHCPGDIVSHEVTLCPRGATRLARVRVFNTQQAPPDAGGVDEPAKWQGYHFIDLSVLDVVVWVWHIGDSHYVVHAVDLRSHCFHYFDSIKDGFAKEQAARFRDNAKQWLLALSSVLGIREFETAEWMTYLHTDGISMPHQTGPDCACFAASVVACICRGEEFAFQQHHMTELRMQLYHLIVHYASSEYSMS